MAEQLEQWSIEKVMACLEHVVDRDVLPSISQEERNRIEYTDVFQEEKELYLFLMLLYERSKGKLEIYGTINELIESLRKTSRIPDFIKFSSTSGVKVSSNCALLTQCVEYTERIEETIYSSQSDIAISLYVHVTDAIKSFQINELTYVIFQTWQTTRLNEILQGYEESYNIIPLDSRKPFIDACEKFRMREPNIKVPEESVTFETFFKLRAYFVPNYVKVLDDILEYFKDEMRDVKKQDYIKETYAQVVFLIENIKKIYDEHAGIFELPSKIKKTPSKDDKPVIRLFNNGIFGDFYLSKEIENSIQKLMITDESRKKCKDLILVESEEERKNGIVYATTTSEFLKLLEELNCNHESFAIFTTTLEEDFRDMSLPIISSYGTHCIPVLEAFGCIVHHLAVILNIFQRSKAGNLQKILKWIDNVVDSFFVEKSVFYLVELSKVDEIIEKARTDLNSFLTEKPAFSLDSQKTYTRKDVDEEIFKLRGTLAWKRKWFDDNKYIIRNMPSENITIKYVYNGYCQMILHYLENSQTVKKLIVNQFSYDGLNPKAISESHPPTSSKKQEPKQQENIPSCSTENAGNRDQKLGEGLKKFGMNKDKIEKLEEKKVRLNTVDEHSEKEIKKLQEELKKSQKSNAELEGIMNNMISQLNTLTVNFQEQIQTPREDLETENVKNMELENKSEMPDDDREELKRKVELLMSENEEFRAQKLRMTEFEKGVAKHTKNALQNLYKSRDVYPDLVYLENAERDVLNLKLCLDEYRGNVAGYQPLAD